MLDLVLLNPGNRSQLYQKLGADYAGIEPPLWIGLMATFLRRRGYGVEILDVDAEAWTPQEAARRTAELKPRLAAVIVFGANPSASTMKMGSAGEICRALRDGAPDVKTLLGGVHVSALPRRTLEEEAVDFVCEGEGPHTLQALIEVLRAGRGDYDKVPGLWYRQEGDVAHTAPAPLIQDLEGEMPGVAWDLLPMAKYRAHNWHCFDDLERRSPYGVVYTSLGCPFKCTFCCINAPFGKPSIRYRDPAGVVREIDHLVTRYGVRHIKIIDEMFVLDGPHVEAVCDGLAALGHDLNIWAYARVDTVKEPLMDRMRRAGIRWLAYGIESADKKVRDGVVKRFTDATVESAMAMTRRAGIHVIGNYIFGLPDDDLDSMQATLGLAKSLNTEFANFYCAMAYPGSRLHGEAVREGMRLPDRWQGYSQHAEDMLPLPTRHLSAGEVIRFRDQAFRDYFSDPRYLALVRTTFGPGVEAHVKAMLDHTLVRKYAAA